MIPCDTAALKKSNKQLKREIDEILTRKSGSSGYRNDSSIYDQGFVDGLKGRANRYADRQCLERVAWKLASKTKRAQQLRGGYTKDNHGLLLDPYGNKKMIVLQLADPATPEEYKLGYRAGTAQR
jgi:hypothetical protein